MFGLGSVDSVMRAEIYVSGTVQGVWYRENTRRVARELQVVGWVKNLPDGRVEVIAEGEEEQIKKLINWCKRGPPSAEVIKLEVKKKAVRGEFNTFRIVL